MKGRVTPPTSWKGEVLLRIIFLKAEVKKAVQLLRDEMIFMHCLLENKAKHILNRHFFSSCSDTIYSKSIKRNLNKKCHRNVMDTPKRIGLA